MKVIDINTRRNRGKPKLLVNNTTGKITSSESRSDFDTGKRLERIRASLERINRLMADLRRMRDGPLVDDNIRDRDLD